ncbi:MAG TPA: hypothetical protein VH328_07865 [Burkholderiaceae bacterium]|jgi:hypothetical protein|nr:hypothetical protein [Burkholderiaceae bacterium]
MESDRVLQEIAQAAARLIVEEGFDWSGARRRAAEAYAEGRRLRALPTRVQVEDEVRAHIELFHADTQPAELRALREIALRWMLRLAQFKPWLAGAVWRGTATRLSVVRLELYGDDPKAPGIALLNLGVPFEAASESGGSDENDLTLVVNERSATLNDWVPIHLRILDTDDLRGALKPDARGQTWRGDAAALTKMLEDS